MFAAELFRHREEALAAALPGFVTPEEAAKGSGGTTFDVAIDEEQVIPLERFEPVWLDLLADVALGRDADALFPLVRVVDLEGGPWVVAVDPRLVAALAPLDDDGVERLGRRLADAVRADLETLEDPEFRAFRLHDHRPEPYVEWVAAAAAVAEEALACGEQMYVLYGEADDGEPS